MPNLTFEIQYLNALNTFVSQEVTAKTPEQKKKWFEWTNQFTTAYKDLNTLKLASLLQVFQTLPIYNDHYQQFLLNNPSFITLNRRFNIALEQLTTTLFPELTIDTVKNALLTSSWFSQDFFDREQLLATKQWSEQKEQEIYNTLAQEINKTPTHELHKKPYCMLTSLYLQLTLTTVKKDNDFIFPKDPKSKYYDCTTTTHEASIVAFLHHYALHTLQKKWSKPFFTTHNPDPFFNQAPSSSNNLVTSANETRPPKKQLLL
jgi:hypothetical protein